MARYAILLFLFAATALPTGAGFVQTLTGRLVGAVALEKDHVTVDGKKVAWSDVFALHTHTAAKPRARTAWVYLRSGEAWPVQLNGLAGSKLDVISELFGAKQLDVALVAGIDFQPTTGPERSRKVGVLVRSKGEAIPGKLLTITAAKVSIDSIVGVVELPREGMVSYHFAAVKPTPGDDVIELVDGTLLRGKLSLGAAELLLEHAALGQIKLPTVLVQTVVRHPARVLDLSELAPQAVKAQPLLSAAVKQTALLRSAEAAPLFVKGLLLEPSVTVTYQLPAALKGKKGKLRALLLPVAAAQGAVRVQISVAQKVVLEQALAPDAAPTTLALDVSGGEVVTIVVDFGGSLRFPCGAVLGDPYVLWE